MHDIFHRGEFYYFAQLLKLTIMQFVSGLVYGRRSILVSRTKTYQSMIDLLMINHHINLTAAWQLLVAAQPFRISKTRIAEN